MNAKGGTKHPVLGPWVLHPWGRLHVCSSTSPNVEQAKTPRNIGYCEVDQSTGCLYRQVCSLWRWYFWDEYGFVVSMPTRLKYTRVWASITHEQLPKLYNSFIIPNKNCCSTLQFRSSIMVWLLLIPFRELDTSCRNISEGGYV